MNANGIVIFGRFDFFTQCHTPNTQLINKEFNTIAATDPGGVLFQIHQVTPTFHIKNAGKEIQIPCQNATPLFFSSSWSLTIKRGTKATKMNKVKPYGYHESHKRTPESRVRKNLFLNSAIILIEVQNNIFFGMKKTNY
jgi:hypothetical protein